jgi:hypothetical protein
VVPELTRLQRDLIATAQEDCVTCVDKTFYVNGVEVSECDAHQYRGLIDELFLQLQGPFVKATAEGVTALSPSDPARS